MVTAKEKFVNNNLSRHSMQWNFVAFSIVRFICLHISEAHHGSFLTFLNSLAVVRRNTTLCIT